MLSNVTTLPTTACHSIGLDEVPDNWAEAVLPIFNRGEVEDVMNFPYSPEQSWSTHCMCFWNPSLVHKGKDDDEQPADSHEYNSCLPEVFAF